MQAETKHRAAPYSRDAEITRLVEAGLTASEIARELRCHDYTVHTVAQRLSLRLVSPKPRLSAEVKAAMLEMYKRGVRLADIERRVGVNRRTIYDYTIKAQLPHRPPRTPAHLDGVARLHAQGLSDRAIGRELGIPTSTVRGTRLYLKLDRNAERGYQPRLRLAAGVAAALALLISTAALAQEHPMHPPPGMPDPYKGIRNDSGVDCCAGRECRPLVEPLRYGAEGTEALLDGEWKPVPPGSLGPSPDGNAHICVWHVDGKPAVRCLLVPGSA